MTTTVAQLRQLALSSIRQYNSLQEAMFEIKFVQYDPIKKPLSAQDLILFQRINNYKPKDLEVYYPTAEFDEDHLYVYGILAREFSCLLHPRPDRKNNTIYKPVGVVADVWNFVRDQGDIFAKEVANALGRKQVTNDWGGKSAATTRALEELHHHGFIRVSKRMNGNKVYEPAKPINTGYSPEKRLSLLTQLMVKHLAPVSESGLRRAIGQLCVVSSGLEGRATVIDTLVAAGEIECHTVNGVRYYLPTSTTLTKQKTVGNKVRFLAPFDPVVWDRKRFEHLWGWTYRFEAYMPQHLRQFGYYALPMFWRDQAIGWVNITKSKNGKIEVERGFAETRKQDKDFERAYDQEVSRFECILSN